MNMFASLRRQLLIALALLMGCAAAVQAQQAPVLKLIVPFPAGGAADFMGRLLAEKLKDEMGQPVIVENRAGAGIRVGATALKNLPADGSTVLLAPDTPIWIAPAIYSKLAFDPAVDFQTVTDVAMVQLGLAVDAKSPVESIADLVSSANVDPGRGTLGITAVGSMVHFLASEFAAKSGSKITLVPYNGAAPMMTNLMGGHIAAGMDATTTFLEHHRSGKLRVLAVAGSKRSSTMPDVPTFAESGYPSLVADSRYILYMHAGAPRSAVNRWNQAMRKVLAQAEVQEKLGRSGYDVLPGSSPEEAARASKATADRWLPIVKASGFKGD